MLPVLAWAAPFASPRRCLTGIDFQAYFRGHYVAAAKAFASEGELPRWNPYQYSGTPLEGNFQIHLYYPPNALFLLLPPDDVWEILVVLHVLLAALGTYRLARGFRVSRTGAVLAGLAFALSLSTGARVMAGHLPNLVSQSQAPVLFLLLFRLLERPGPRRAAALAAWIGVMVHSGTPQWLYHAGFVGLGAIAWKVVARRRRREPCAAVLGWAAAAGGIGLLLGAATWIPALETGAESMRGQIGPFYSGLRLGREDAFFPDHLLHFVVPRTTGLLESAPCPLVHWHEQAVYIGILPLLAALGALSRRPAPAVKFFAAVAIGSIVTAMAGLTPIHLALSAIPGYSVFRIPARIVWVTVLALSVLAGFGWDRMRSCGPRFLIGTTSALAALALVAGFVLHAPVRAGMAVALAAAGAVLLRWVPGRPSVCGVAVLVAALDLVFFGAAIQTVQPRELVERPPAVASFIGAPRDDYRLLDLTAADGSSLAVGIRSLNGYGHPTPRHLERLYRQAWKDYAGPPTESLGRGTELADTGPLELLNVRWIRAPAPLDHPGLREIGRPEGSVLHELAAARPMAFTLDGEGTVVFARPGINRIELECRRERPGTVVISESWMPGWRARVNGSPAAVVPAYEALMRVEVPAGESRVDLVYAPFSGALGRWLSAAGLAMLACTCAFGIRAGRRTGEVKR